MKLGSIKLINDPGMQSSNTPLFLLIKGNSKRLVTSPVLKKKQPDLHKHTRDEELADGFIVIGERAYRLLKNKQYLAAVRKKKAVIKPVPNGALIVRRIHPNLLTPKQRVKLVGLGEKGEVRRQFVEEGLTGEEQRHRAREAVTLLEAGWRRKSRAVKKERRKQNRSRSDYQDSSEPDEPSVPTDARYGAAHVAKAAGLEPTLVRRFLRSKKIGKRGGRYAFTKAEAEKIARAAKKHYREEA